MTHPGGRPTKPGTLLAYRMGFWDKAGYKRLRLLGGIWAIMRMGADARAYILTNSRTCHEEAVARAARKSEQ